MATDYALASEEGEKGEIGNERDGGFSKDSNVTALELHAVESTLHKERPRSWVENEAVHGNNTRNLHDCDIVECDVCHKYGGKVSVIYLPASTSRTDPIHGRKSEIFSKSRGSLDHMYLNSQASLL